MIKRVLIALMIVAAAIVSCDKSSPVSPVAPDEGIVEVTVVKQ